MTTPHSRGTRRAVAGVHAHRCCPSWPVDTRLRLHRSPGGQVRSHWHTRLRAPQPGRATRSLDAREDPARGKATPKPSFIRRRPFCRRSPRSRAQASGRARTCAASSTSSARRRPGSAARSRRCLTRRSSTVGGSRRERARALRVSPHPERRDRDFVRTSSTVQDGSPAPRDLFVKRWKPTAASSGKVFVIAPGFLETGRNQ